MQVFNEDTRVKIPATIQFLRLGYHYQPLKADDIDIDFSTKIFVNRFKPALEVINGRKFTYDEIDRMINKRLQNPDYKKFFNLIQFVSFSNNMELHNIDNVDFFKLLEIILDKDIPKNEAESVTGLYQCVFFQNFPISVTGNCSLASQ